MHVEAVDMIRLQLHANLEECCQSPAMGIQTSNLLINPPDHGTRDNNSILKIDGTNILTTE